MTSRPTPILVTGGAGYVGAHACKRLAAEGYLPVTYDNLSEGRREFVRWGPLEVGDLNDRARLAETIRRWQPEAVMHFAALARVGESVAEPGRYYLNNVAGSLNLLRVMLDLGLSRLIFSSSCSTYGLPAAVPMGEDHPQVPINPYGWTKLIVEQMMSSFEEAHGFRAVALRYFNAAGADPEGEIGEDHQPETHLIPLVLDAAAGRSPALDVFGADYDTPDGTCVRDYVHVADLAEAHVAALRHLEAGGESLRLNLGVERGHSVLEVLAAAEAVVGRAIPRRFAPRRPGDPPTLIGEASRARRRLGWTPRRSSLHAIIEDAWGWHRRRFGRPPD